MERVFQRSFPPSHFHITRHTRVAFWGRKIPSLPPKSQNSEGWEPCNFVVGVKWSVNLEDTEELTRLIVAKKEVGRNALITAVFRPWHFWKMYDTDLEKICCEISEPKRDNAQCGFGSGRSTTGKIFTSPKNFRKRLRVCQTCLRLFTTRFIKESFGNFCMDTALTAVMLLVIGYSNTTQNFVSVLTVSYSKRSPLM